MENKFYALFFFVFFSFLARGQDSTRCNAAFNAASGGSQVYFRANDSTTGVAHFWDFGDSTRLGFGNYPAVLHTYIRSGSFTVIHLVRDSAGNCHDSSSQLVYIPGATPQCGIYYYYSHDSIHGGPYSFYAIPNLLGATADTVTWTIGDTTAGRGDTLTRNLRPGTYTVCATLSTNLGCISRYCQNIVVGDSLPGITPPPDSTSPPGIVLPPDSSRNPPDSSARPVDSLSTAAGYIPSWPNPSSNQVNMDVILDKAGMILIRVYNSMGNPVQTKAVAGVAGTNRLTLPIADLQSGLYFIQVQYGNEIKRSRIQKM
ncbi:MAG TPA: PKD domain-containing protein [Puia sp.]|jgi:hypothetical protein|nr:PKD domain-containing protein [Puia sp.]